jgi:hypothetical protein
MTYLSFFCCSIINLRKLFSSITLSFIVIISIKDFVLIVEMRISDRLLFVAQCTSFYRRSENHCQRSDGEK